MYILVIVLIIVVFISIFTINKKNRIKRMYDEESVLIQLDKINFFAEDIKRLRNTYISISDIKYINDEYKDTYDFFSTIPYSVLRREDIQFFIDHYPNIEQLVKKWNIDFVNNELIQMKEFFDKIDGKSLDEQQRIAVITDEDNNLVLAGAGSGKTLTIAAKVKYLIECKEISPDDILLISFTKKAAEEMQERVTKNLGLNVDVKTFHKLGLDIITDFCERRFDISEDLGYVVNLYLNEFIVNDDEKIESLLKFFGCYLEIAEDIEKFKNLGEYYDVNRNCNFETIKSKYERQKELEDEIRVKSANKITLKDETVKSLEEVKIANFLFLNGIKYEYEMKYPFDSEDKYKKAYRPDFYLPEYDLYLEHFGISENNKVPWLTKIEEKKYLDGIKWKRKHHKKNKTKLIETYSYFNKNGVLLEKLKSILLENEVVFNKPNFEDIYKKVFLENKENNFKELKKLIETFIGLFKSNGYSIEMFDKMRKKIKKINESDSEERYSLFIDLVEPIYKNYQSFLEEKDSIDFNDMLNNATEIVKNNPQYRKYKYIIIDEYQDISVSKFKLVNELRNKNTRLLCVGDDWQSIYRFAGSDIALFSDFKNYVGKFELLKIEKTYRNSQELINIAGSFIMKNPKQLSKNLTSLKNHSNPIRMISYRKYNSSSVDLRKDMRDKVKQVISEIVGVYGEKTDILILGRNNFDIENLLKKSIDGKMDSDFEIKNKKDNITILYKKYPKLKISFLTVHRSKGLEATNVIMINLENNLVGFPNKISDDPVLSLVLSDSDNYNYAEERRLFYVALTRTKNVAYLIVPDERESQFCEELVKDFSIKKETDNPNLQKEAVKCPVCQKGKLVIRMNGDNRKFLACNNYPFCTYTNNHLEIINDQVICDRCKGYMVKRTSSHGEFYGCTNYPTCNNTINIIGKDQIRASQYI